MFDFLNLGKEAYEREVEQTLVNHTARFILELITFVGKQYHLEVDGDDFYIDPLFYLLKLHCYMAIELKNGPFRP